MAMSREQRIESLKAHARVVAKAWEDEAFKQQLPADPKATLQAEGMAVPGVPRCASWRARTNSSTSRSRRSRLGFPSRG